MNQVNHSSGSVPLSAIRGMHDVLPAAAVKWRYLEHMLSHQAFSFGYQQMRTPIIERSELFQRGIGDVTDIVEKEMYTFTDRHGESLCLRPENTASCVRAAIEHGLLYHQQQKFWYLGAMFRHERPQKGRYRQFHQFGIELLGYAEIGADIEILLLAYSCWQKLKLQAKLEINSLGGTETRQRYKQALTAYLQPRYQDLDPDSQKRLLTNPLRILDSKNPHIHNLLAEAPRLADYLNTKEQQRFAQVCTQLTQLGIPFRINPHLVRGLDYYNDLVFEWTTDQLGSQATICAGGRYDHLISQLGGPATPAIGFAVGMERLLLLTEQQNAVVANLSCATDIYLINLIATDEAQISAWQIVNKLRQALPKQCIQTSLQSAVALKKQLKKAHQLQAKYVLILGEQEWASGDILLKNMQDGAQRRVPLAHIEQHIKQVFYTQT